MASHSTAGSTRAQDLSVVIVLTTLPAGVDAAAFARTLVEERLAACVSVGGEMRSVYRWKGAVEEDREHQLVMKTVRRSLGPLRARIASLHPYELPEFLVIPTDDGDSAYAEWVRRSTGA